MLIFRCSAAARADPLIAIPVTTEQVTKEISDEDALLRLSVSRRPWRLCDNGQYDAIPQSIQIPNVNRRSTAYPSHRVAAHRIALELQSVRLDRIRKTKPG